MASAVTKTELLNFFNPRMFAQKRLFSFYCFPFRISNAMITNRFVQSSAVDSSHVK